MPSAPPSSMKGRTCAFGESETRTVGGEADTGLKELTVVAMILPSVRVAHKTTELAQWAMASRKRSGEEPSFTVAKMNREPTFRHLCRMTELLSAATISVPLEALQEGALGGGASHRARAMAGAVGLIGLAWLLSRDRARISWRLVFWGVALKAAFAVLVLQTPAGVALFEWANGVVMAILGYALEGAGFLFGNLISDNVPVGLVEADGADQGAFREQAGRVARTGAFFAFAIFPNIIFASCLMAVLYHYGLMQIVVRGIAKIMQRTLRSSGAETLCAASNAFIGLMEAPLTVRPFLASMTTSELMTVMTVGMATISGGTLVAYTAMLLPYSPEIGGHIIAATIMSVPAAVVVAKLMVPETEKPETLGRSAARLDQGTRADANGIDAAARGAAEGLELSMVVGSMLIAFVALIAMLNGVVGWLGGAVGIEGLSLEGALGSVLAPVAWGVGIPWGDAALAGEMIGIDFVVNEFVAFVELEGRLAAGTAEGAGVLGARSLVVLTYALTTYANLGSVAMTLAGIGAVAPSRRADLARLGLRAAVAGLLASLLTAAIAGVLA